MAAPYNPPIKGEDFQIIIALRSIADPNAFKNNPQINAGDFKVMTWNPGSPTPTFLNVATMPVVLDPAGPAVLVTLSASEFNGDIIALLGRQQGSPNEWADFMLSIPTTSS